MEYAAALLLSTSGRLRQFELSRFDAPPKRDSMPGGERVGATEQKLRDVIAQEHAEMRATMGFTLWQTYLQLRELPPGSEEQVRLVQSLLQPPPSPLILVAILKMYEFSSMSVTVRQIQEKIAGTEHDDDAKAFLLALLHPTPRLTPDQVTGALTLATQCPALDQWIVFLRCAQALYVGGESQLLSSLKLTPELLGTVISAESSALSRLCYYSAAASAFEPSPYERAIVARFYSDDSTPHPDPSVAEIVRALERLASAAREEVVGGLALLDRFAASNTGFWEGGFFGALVYYFSVLTERRTIFAGRWLNLHVHPEIAAMMADRSLFGAVLRRQVGGGDAKQMDEAELALRDGNWDGAIERVSSIKQSREAVALALEARLGSRTAEAAIAIAACACVEHQELLHRIPLLEVIGLIPKRRQGDVEDCIASATVLDLGVRHLATEHSRRRNFAVEDALRAAGARVPTELASVVMPKFAARLLPNFLATICIPSVMDTIPVGSNTRELLEERIRILQYLLKRSDGNRAELEQEIVGLSATIAVAAEQASLDQQRIYVDTEGLTARLLENIREHFELYRRFQALDVRRAPASELAKRIQELAPDVVVIDVEELLRMLTSEADRHLLQIVNCLTAGATKVADRQTPTILSD